MKRIKNIMGKKITINYVLGILVLLLSLTTTNLFSQVPNVGIFFQAVARDNFSNPSKDRKIFVQSSIIQATATGTKVLTEEYQTSTDATGVFSISVGQGVRIGGTANNLTGIDWSMGPYYLNLKIAISPTAPISNWDYTKDWVDLGTTSFGAVPFALYAGTASGVDQKVNITDTAKMLSLYAKTLTVKTLETMVSNRLTIADSLTSYVTPAQLASKTFDQTPITNAIATKLNSNDTASLSNRINLKLDANKVGVANGLATLNASGIIPSNQLPPVTVSSTSVVASEADMLALTNATVGSIAIRTDLNKNYILSTAGASVLANWVELLTPGAPVQTVNGYIGSVNLIKSDIGLANVENTSDINKVISNATQTALNFKLDANKLAVANGAASLNALGKIPTDQIPAISFSSVKVLNSEAAMLALSAAVVGSVVIRTDVNKNYVLAEANPAVLVNWIELLTPAPPVQTVNGYTGSVSLTKSDIGLNNVENTSDANKLVSTATQTALDLKANTTSLAVVASSGSYDDLLNLPTAVNASTISGTVAIAKGGTGATNAADARINLGLVIGTNVQAPLTAGTDYLTPSGSAANLTNFPTLNQNTTGNAATATIATTAIAAGTASTATKLATAKKINNVDFDGSGDITVTADAGTLTGTTLNSTLTGSSLTSVGTLANLTVTNAIAGSITGNAATATIATTAIAAGTASTATKLTTAKKINNVDFDGSGDITVTADAGTLTGTTLKSTVTSSSLTSVGTIASLTTGAITNNGKVIVGASSAASASAVLEASSTTQGFLPPRMTGEQRNQIASPATGLMVYCTNCGSAGGEPQYYNGSAWVNMIGGAALMPPPPAIGDAYQGGIVAYVLQLGDPGYHATIPHGLIAATSDQSNQYTGIRWNNGSFSTTGATGTAIGTGLANTNTIISLQGGTSTSYAAGLARAHNGGGYNDWYLPSKDELDKLYINRGAIGGFETSYYWSSTEGGGYTASKQNLSNGAQEGDYKDRNSYVRAVRAF